jgi:hypothetical protein
VGRVVMLAPPNQGAHAANTFAPIVGWLLRPVSELGSDSASTVRRLPRVKDVTIGVIAARDDRTVKLPETHLARGGKDALGHEPGLIRFQPCNLKAQRLKEARHGFEHAETLGHVPQIVFEHLPCDLALAENLDLARVIRGSLFARWLGADP